MCDNSLFTSGIVRPDEVSRLQAIYGESARQYWFDQNSEAKRAFATHLTAIYRGGLVDVAKLRRFFILHAAAYFNKGSPRERESAKQFADESAS